MSAKPKSPKRQAPGGKRQGAGRKKIPVLAATVRALARVGCTLEDIAGAVGIARRTFIERAVNEDSPQFDHAIRDAFEAGKAECRVSLRRMQWTAAKRGSTGMQIWLGKQLLGQREFVSVRHGGDPENQTPIQTKSTITDERAEILSLVTPFEPAGDEGGDDPMVGGDPGRGEKEGT
jgi:hypothetical protein